MRVFIVLVAKYALFTDLLVLELVGTSKVALQEALQQRCRILAHLSRCGDPVYSRVSLIVPPVDPGEQRERLFWAFWPNEVLFPLLSIF